MEGGGVRDFAKKKIMTTPNDEREKERERKATERRSKKGNYQKDYPIIHLRWKRGIRQRRELERLQ